MARRRRRLRRHHPRPGVRYSALVPNRAGSIARIAAGVREVAIFAAASETFSRRNINQSIDESFATYRGGRVPRRSQAGLRVRALSVHQLRLSVRGRGGPVRGSRAAPSGCSHLGAFEVAVSDTIGIAHPGQVQRVLDARASRRCRAIGSRCTFTTRAARRSPTCSRRSSTASRRSTARPAGLAAVPYAPGAAGNLATEDLLYMLTGSASRPVCRSLEWMAASRADRARALAIGSPSRLRAGSPGDAAGRRGGLRSSS